MVTTMTPQPLVELHSVGKTYVAWTNIRRVETTAVANVSMAIMSGQTFALVGASGSGKSTLGRIVAGLEAPSSGDVVYKGLPLRVLSKRERNTFRQSVQVIFQDPVSALNPQMTTWASLAEPFYIQDRVLYRDKQKLRLKLQEMLNEVELPQNVLDKRPYEMSGGQCQRIAIARTFALRPELVVCDESLSALDPPVQVTILRLLKELQRKYNTAYLFITHDLEVAHSIADKICVLHEGNVVAAGDAALILSESTHPAVDHLRRAILKVGEHRFLQERI